MICSYLIFLPPLVVIAALFWGVVFLIAAFWWDEHKFNKARRQARK